MAKVSVPCAVLSVPSPSWMCGVWVLSDWLSQPCRRSRFCCGVLTWYCLDLGVACGCCVIGLSQLCRIRLLFVVVLLTQKGTVKSWSYFDGCCIVELIG